MTTNNTPQRLQSLLLVLHYNKNHSYVLFVHIFLDSLKSPAKFQPFQSQLSRNFASPIMHIFGKCRGPHAMTFLPCDPRYFFWRQGAAAPLRPPAISFGGRGLPPPCDPLLSLLEAGGCRPPATPCYLFWRQGIVN